MKRPHADYEIDDDRARLDFGRVTAWLASSYWSPGIARDKVERAAAGSALVVGAYQNGEQTAYCRVVGDGETFAWLCDVFVDEAHRGRGLARALVRFALDHPDHQGLRRWMLATQDAHGVYARLGFTPLPQPERMMVFRP